MTAKIFFDRVLPQGLVVIAKLLAGGGFKHYVCDTVDAALEKATAIDGAHEECYFGLGAVKEKRIWGENKKIWRVRIGTNIRALKALWLDIDIGIDSPHKYATRQEAFLAIKKFCKDAGLPKPLIVSSGGGLHVYWPLTREITVEAWRPVAQQFKALTVAYGLKADPSRTADASSVLRIPGTHNYKQDTPRAVEIIQDAGPYSPKLIHDAITEACKIYQVPPAVPTPAASPFDALGSNTEFAPQEPASFEMIAEACGQVQNLLQTGGASQTLWYQGLQLVRFCENSYVNSIAISKNHPTFDPTEMDQKIAQLTNANIGPTLCAKMHEQDRTPCEACPHWGKIKTPLVLGRRLREAEPPEVEIPATEEEPKTTIKIPNPPYPYMRVAGKGIALRQPSKSGEGEGEPEMVHNHDIYPLRRMYDERLGAEVTVWRVQQPISGWAEVPIPQGVLAAPEKLHGILLSQGIVVPHSRIKLMVAFMIAYIAELQKQAVSEKLFAKLGFREDHKVFVLDDTLYRQDGTAEAHRMSADLKAEIPGLRRGGTLEGWQQAIQFYNRPGYEAHRFMLYGAFGSPLFHTTGNYGAIVNATGKPGGGKTTILLAINSIWGHARQLMLNGTKAGTTQNSLYSLLSLHNNLPVCLDEITRMEAKMMSEFALSVSQGQGKRRMLRSGNLAKMIESWALLVYAASNTDAYMGMGLERKDAEAETMRVFQIPLAQPNVHTKGEADTFIREGLGEHYGHAGHVFAAYVVANYSAVCQMVQDAVKLIDAKASVRSGERFWSGIVAVHYVGACIARQLGLIADFPVERDIKWATDHITDIRQSITDSILGPKDIMAEYIDARGGETLILSQFGPGNISPRVDLAPRGALTIRYEKDYGRLYLNRTEFRRYCLETGANYRDIQEQLTAEKVLLDPNAQKVLGAGTDIGKGQVRCWLIDVTKLDR